MYKFLKKRHKPFSRCRSYMVLLLNCLGIKAYWLQTDRCIADIFFIGLYDLIISQLIIINSKKRYKAYSALFIVIVEKFINIFRVDYLIRNYIFIDKFVADSKGNCGIQRACALTNGILKNGSIHSAFIN